MGTLATLVVNLVLNPAQFNAGLAAARTQASGTMTALGALGGVAAVGAAVGFAKAGQAALEWDDSMAGVRRTVELSNEEMGHASEIYTGIENDLLDLAKTIPIPTQELAAMAETAGSLGVGTNEITEFARVTATLAEMSQDLTPDATARAFGTLRTTMGLTVDDLNNVASAVVKLGISGASTEAEILSMAERASGAFGSLNIPVEDLLAWSAAMANVREFSEAGGTTLQRLGLIIQKNIGTGGEKFAAIAEAAGMTEDAFKELFEGDASAGMFAFIEGLSKLEGAERNALLRASGFTDIRLTRGLNKLVGALQVGKEGNLGDALKDAREGMGDESIFEKMAQARFATTAKQLEILGNYVQVLAIKVGKYLLPAFMMMAQAGMAIVDVIDQLITAFPGLSAVLVPVLAGLSSILALKFGAKLLASLLPGQITTALASTFSGIGTVMVSSILMPFRGLAGALSGAIDAMTAPLAARSAALGTAVGAAFRIAMLAAVLLLLPIIDKMLQDLFKQVDAIKAQLATMKQQAQDVLKKPDETVLTDWETFLQQLEKQPKGGLSLNPLDFTPFGDALKTGANIAAKNLSADAVSDALKNYGDQILHQTNLTQEEITDATAKMWRGVAYANEQGNLELENALRAQIGYLAMRTPGIQHEIVDAMEALVPKGPSVFQQMADNVKGMVLKIPVDVAGIYEGFAEARKAVADGFGSIKKALQHPPKLIPIDTRIANTEKRLKKSMRNVQRATAANDPINQKYWIRATAQAARRVDRMRGQTTETTKAVARKFKDMGINVKPVWDNMKNHAQTRSTQIKNLMVTDAQAAADGIRSAFSFSLYDQGASLMQTLSDGILSKLETVRNAAEQVAAAAGESTKAGSPPKVGPLHHIDRDGANLVQQLSKGMLSQKGLASKTGMEVAGAFRPRWGVGAVAMAGRHGKPRENHYHIGTLVADDQGIDRLDARMAKRRRMKNRTNSRYNESAE